MKKIDFQTNISSVLLPDILHIQAYVLKKNDCNIPAKLGAAFNLENVKYSLFVMQIATSQESRKSNHKN